LTADAELITDRKRRDAPVREKSINELISECSVSKDSLEELYHIFKSSVFALAFSITADYHLAEDCVIETFVRLTQVRRFDPEKGDGRGFIFTVARNVALEIRRSSRDNSSAAFLRDYGDADKIAEDSIFIEQLLSHLPDKMRQIVVLKVCSGLTYREISDVMRCPESTVKSRYAKAIGILKEKAGDNGE